MTDTIRFWLNGEPVEVAHLGPTTTLLEYLREHRRLTGTKEGCAEGDCGACTVVVGELDDTHQRISWRSVNACILFLPMLDGRAVVTVEGVGSPDNLHPVQKAMIDFHGSQCGFCTPGFVMSLYGRHIGAEGTDAPLEDVLAGNLCRCTGYGPIRAAGEACAPTLCPDKALLAALKALQRERGLAYEHDGFRWFAPRSLDELAALRLQYPEARIVAGATDVGLWVTKKHMALQTVISLTEVADLKTLTETAEGLTIGAGVRYVEAHEVLGSLHPDLYELIRRIGAQQVRNSGTIGGNIANGSPIGDTPPALIALGATLTLRRGDARRTLALEDYFIDYGKQDLKPGEFVESLFVPRPGPDDHISLTKLSKRFDSDISAVMAGFRLTLKDGVITQPRIAFGGMAGTPKRARQAEAVLEGATPSLALFEAAAEALTSDFTPLNDVRGTSAYRLEAAGNLIRRWGFKVLGQGGLTSVLEAEAIHG